MIEVRFTNGTQEVRFKHARNVQWAAELADDVLVNQTTRAGKRQRNITVNGFISKADFKENIAAQEQLLTDLMAVGTGTLRYAETNIIENVRFNALEWDEFRGNPVAGFSATFATEEDNVHAHEPVGLGSLTLSPANGVEYVSVEDNTQSQGDDEGLVAGKNRRFTIEGTLIGSTLAEVNTAQAAIAAAVEGSTTITLTLSTAVSTFAGTYTVRPGQLQFGAPTLKDQQTARSFSFECATFEDYTKEPYTLGEVAQSFANIQIDVVEGVDHKRTNEKVNTGAIYTITDEELVVTGKRYFDDWADYIGFRDPLNPVPTNTYLFTSTTGNILELQEAQIGSFDRDGNNVDGSKRYSASVTLTFRWDVGVEGRTLEYNATYLGLPWYLVENVSFSATVDEDGNVTSRGFSASGKVATADNAALFSDSVGTKKDWNPGLTDCYITSVSLNSLETRNVSGVAVPIYSITISGRQLDTASQAKYFIQSLFRFANAGASGTSYNADTIQFSKVTSLNKSISNNYKSLAAGFTVSSISISISGEVWTTDDGSGSPVQPNRIIDLFNKIDSLLNVPLSNSEALTVAAGDTLPNNAGVHFMLTNFSVGDWQSFVKPNGTGAGDRYWKQTVSLSANAVFDLNSGSSTQPESVETTSRVFNDEAPKFTQLQVVGFGTVFKRTGTTPAKEVATAQIQYRDLAALEAGGFPADPTGPTSFSVANEQVRRSEETRGLTKRVIVEWQATEKL